MMLKGKSIYKWMMTGGTPMTSETSIYGIRWIYPPFLHPYKPSIDIRNRYTIDVWFPYTNSWPWFQTSRFSVVNGYLKMPVPDSNEVGDDPKDQPRLGETSLMGMSKAFKRFILT